MAAEFHFFPLLPWELREMIRKLATRPSLPGAHFFSVCNADDSEHARLELKTYYRDWYFQLPPPRLAAPRCLPRGVDFSPAAAAAAPASLTLNNPSTYLIDSGLWTACKESLQNGALQKQKATTTTYAASDDSGRRYLTVFPGKDLIIIQPYDDIAALNWDFVLDGFPLYEYLPRWGGWNRRYQLFRDERHMAVEYDPAWDMLACGTPERVQNLLVDMAWNAAQTGPFTLWFIDYRIKRSPRYQATEEQAKELRDYPPKAFYASDRRFVQVKNEQLGLWAGHDKMWDCGYELNSFDDVPGYYHGALMFIANLEGEMTDRWDYDKNYWIEGLDLNWIDFGLLACGYL
ncbi:hypothetical protein B0T19DRAFT_487485 [Cercophora scortea]|uniref:Uncharacterized protein n=1 Tax=Cercophora scortea TaxID=314031 RepID=A0AAE0M6G6_9PEZI|nr:hypothetical protein B0T19DRAFT_487485 [Cercophora scortea]